MDSQPKNEMIFSILKELEIFSDLDESALIALSHLFEEKEYLQNSIIFEEGSIGTSMMIIAQGKVRVSQKANQETEEALKILHTGEVFGEMALLEDLPRSAAIIAHTNVIIISVDRFNFLKFLEQDCRNGLKIMIKLAKTLSSRLREADVKLKTFVNLTQWI
ncbi:MAG: cyclic nucleotide-binding domain-containing protein, partial [Candidatus Aminicenantes bacterium]|nr:cyclic nucleotide-binding domain-containing protein [Candidatus Aminicenantes bacterium]